jgi:hypothetical protein
LAAGRPFFYWTPEASQELAEVRNPLNLEIDAFNSLTFDLAPKTGQTAAPQHARCPATLRLKADLLAAKSEECLEICAMPEPIQNFGFADGQDRFEGYSRNG